MALAQLTSRGLAATTNTGSAPVSVGFGDVAALSGNDYELRY